MSDKRYTGLITFLSDFGTSGGYVAACEATIVLLAPTARVLHISHELAPGDITWGSMVLARTAELAPPCIHLAVIDPGVGTERHPVALVAQRGDVLVGPDNGLLALAAHSLGGVREAWILEPERLRSHADLPRADLSPTFHGRDIFAPAAALVALDVPLSEIARPLDPAALVNIALPVFEITSQTLRAEVVEIDRFGNVGLAARFDDSRFAKSSLLVEIEDEDLPDWDARLVQTFGQLRSGELGVYRDSWGYVALALNGASAAELLSLERGMMVCISARDEK